LAGRFFVFQKHERVFCMVEKNGNISGKSACFTGHRRIGSGELPVLKQRLDEAIENLIREGVTTFHCGGALGFDSLAGNAVLGFKAKYDMVRLVMLLPCTDQDKSWSENDKEPTGSFCPARMKLSMCRTKRILTGA
jgi:hypothetical protein